MVRINLKHLDRTVYDGNGLMSYIKLGELIGMGLVIQHGDCRHGIVEVELTEKGQAVLAKGLPVFCTDTPNSPQYLDDGDDLTGLLRLCQTGNLYQTQETVRENP